LSSTIGYVPLPSLEAPNQYDYGPFSSPMEGSAAGTTLRLELSDSQVYPGARRSVWLHLPSGADASTPLNYCVFQDGWLYLDPAGPVRAGIVLDNLHARGLIPPTVGIFVDAGAVPPEQAGAVKQRNVEYDPFTPAYGSFLRDEVFPAVEAHARLVASPEGNVICGGSSGGNCAFTAAWFHPDLFEASICFVSSFAQIPGGNPVPRALASTPVAGKRLRVFQQIAHRDLYWDRPERNWVAENFRVAAALLDRGDDVRCVVGDGGHSPNHGGVLLPDALMWAAGTTPA
jgi:enterochelin esterase-like enzyme